MNMRQGRRTIRCYLFGCRYVLAFTRSFDSWLYCARERCEWGKHERRVDGEA